MFYRGIPYDLDLVVCRKAMVNRQVEGDLDSMESLAGKVEISRSTASRFFSGRPTSLAVMLRILSVLNLKFDEVARPADQPDDTRTDSDGTAGAAVKPQPGPPSDRDRTARRPQDGTTA